MGRARTYRGRSTQGEVPEWGPLLDAVGERVTGDFMWMFEVELTNGARLQAYKHIDTRCYVHLAADGAAYVYEHEDRYREIPLIDLLSAVFAPLVGLASVTSEQVGASWAVIDRLISERAKRG
jgi:hypothetical protein